jgi:hypothetical protein
MDIDCLIVENNILKNEIKTLKEALFDCQEHLKKYTSPVRNKKYYETHKEILLEKAKTNPVPSEKRKEYNKKYYLSKKNNNVAEK